MGRCGDKSQAKSETKSEKPAAEPKQHDGEESLRLVGERKPPPLPKGLLPKVLEDFTLRQAELMGCDPAGLAMGALTVCGAAITDLIKIQPKEHEPEWKQSGRLWSVCVVRSVPSSRHRWTVALTPISKSINK